MTPLAPSAATSHSAAVWFGPSAGPQRPARAALAALLLACMGPGLSACGQKGALKLPQQAAPAAASASAAVPATSAAVPGAGANTRP